MIGYRGRILTVPGTYGAAHPLEVLAARALQRTARTIARGDVDRRNDIFLACARVLPSFGSVELDRDGGLILARTALDEVALPETDSVVPLFQIGFGYASWLGRKYQLKGFAAVEPGDVVVDCGAFVGGFSLSVRHSADRVIAVEPSAANFRALEKNVGGMASIECCQVALWNEEAVLPLHHSTTNVDDSLFEPDEGATGRSTLVRATTLSTLLSELECDRADFVKVEAEGAEREVLDGLRELRPRAIAVDCSPERDGASEIARLSNMLEGIGYDVLRRNWIVFARRRESISG